MTKEPWKEEFENDFRNKVFSGMSQEENTQEAIKYFTVFIEQQIHLAEDRGRAEMKEKILKRVDSERDFSADALNYNHSSLLSYIRTAINNL